MEIVASGSDWTLGSFVASDLFFDLNKNKNKKKGINNITSAIILIISISIFF